MQSSKSFLARFGPDSLPILRRIVGESLRRYWRAYAAGVLTMIVVAATTAATAWIMRDVVNKIFVERNSTLLWVISAAIILIFVVKGVATYLQLTILGRVGNRIVASMQQRVFDHILGLDMSFFASRPSSDIIVRVTRGAQAARQVVELIVVSIGRDLLTVIALCVVMIVQAPLLSILALFTAPFAIFFISRLGRRISTLARAEILSTGQIINLLQEATHGARIVKAFGLDGYMQKRMAVSVAEVEARSNKITVLQARTSPLMDTLGGVAVGLVVLVAGWQAITQGQTPGEFMAFLTALLLAYEPAKRLARFHVTLESALSGVRMLFQILDALPGPTESATGPALKVTEGRIEFRGVSFAYRPELAVLKNISFTVAGGEKVALVGPSGAGKTTILNLIQRFYDPETGEVLIDGQNIRSVSAPSLRSTLAFVSQDTYLFSGSVKENIRLGRIGASDADIERAARDAHADDFIRELPEGFDTPVGENGLALSGGQRQRIAIARALLKDAPIILLDEATSALDSETERKIQDALARLTQDRTTIVIAHRLSTVVDADRILVVDNGQIVEEGRHPDLLRKGGIYERLSRLQFADERTADDRRPARIV
jgi:subfamily B ATP-binding cassette protein MsbA